MNLEVWEQLGGAWPCRVRALPGAQRRQQALCSRHSFAHRAAALDKLEKDRAVRGVVIVSGLKKDIFTAGCAVQPLCPCTAQPVCADCASLCGCAATTSRSFTARRRRRSGTRASGTRRRGAWCARRSLHCATLAAGLTRHTPGAPACVAARHGGGGARPLPRRGLRAGAVLRRARHVGRRPHRSQ